MKAVLKMSILAGLLLVLVRPEARAQSFEVQQLILDIEKLAQLKGILKDLENGYKILDAGYSTIRDISHGTFDLHKAFLDGLLAVSPAVKNYKRVADIVNLQLALLSKYQSAWKLFQQDRHFRPEELTLMSTVYGNLLDQSAKDLDDLVNILTDGQLRANDAERISQIDAIYGQMLKKSGVLDGLNNSSALLSMQRASDENDLELLKKLYGVTGQ